MGTATTRRTGARGCVRSRRRVGAFDPQAGTSVVPDPPPFRRSGGRGGAVRPTDQTTSGWDDSFPTSPPENPDRYDSVCSPSLTRTTPSPALSPSLPTSPRFLGRDAPRGSIPGDGRSHYGCPSVNTDRVDPHPRPDGVSVESLPSETRLGNSVQPFPTFYRPRVVVDV